MADYRQIHTSIWDDDWFCQLSSDEKIVFIWLFSNRRASVSGIYKFAEFICSRETGISLAEVKKAIQKLASDQKIYIEGEWVWVKNLRKYNDSKSPNSYKRIASDLEMLPDNGLKKAYLANNQDMTSPYQAHTKPLQGDSNAPLEQEQENEHEQEKEKENEQENALDPFSLMQKTIEKLVGYPARPQDMSVITEFINVGITEKDIKDAIAFLNGKKKVYGASDLKGSVMTSHGINTQKNNGHNAPVGIPDADGNLWT